MTRDDERSARQIARSARRKAGDRSADLARDLMNLPPPKLRQLQLDDDLREVIERARAISSQIARRRAERTVAAALRGHDLVELAAALRRVDQHENADQRFFRAGEQWRTRMIEEGAAAMADFPPGADPQLPRLIDAAQRERTTGRPPGAARALFRHVVERLKAAETDEAETDEADTAEADTAEADTDEADETDEAPDPQP